MSDTHYFPRYSQKENVVTNNALLLLLRLYDYNRLKFGRFLRELFGDEMEFTGVLGLQFKQQRGSGKSVVDGYIAQESVTIVVETKRAAGAFTLKQLRRHLNAFKNESHKLLVLLSPVDDALDHEIRSRLLEFARESGVTVLSVSFERIIEAARKTLSEHDEDMLDLVEDFAVFCSEEGLLPRDRYTMLVPPCGKSFDDNIAFSLYYCPAAWNRRRSAYLGIYKEKAVQWVGRIGKVVRCDVDSDGNTVTPFDPDTVLSSNETERIVGATKAAYRNNGWRIEKGRQFFLCDRLEATAFLKTSPGGIQGHRYFDLAEVLEKGIPDDVSDLASALRDVTWT